LQVVPLMTVPERVWAAAEARVIANVEASITGFASLDKNNSL
jgi:hypothetical protein